MLNESVSARRVGEGKGLVKSKFKSLASHGTLLRHSKILRRCDTRRQCRSDDHKRWRRLVSEYQKEFSPSSTFSYRSLRVFATPGIVLPLTVQCLLQLPYLSRYLLAYVPSLNP